MKNTYQDGVRVLLEEVWWIIQEHAKSKMNKYLIKFTGSGEVETVDAHYFEQDPHMARFFIGNDLVASFTNVFSVRLLPNIKEAPPLKIFNTLGKEAELPQHTDAIGGECCRATTSEVKP